MKAIFSHLELKDGWLPTETQCHLGKNENKFKSSQGQIYLEQNPQMHLNLLHRKPSIKAKAFN